MGIEIKAPNIQMLNDKLGKTSMLRFLVAYIVIAFTTVWAYLSIRDGAMYEISWEQLLTVVGPLLAKAYQTGREGQSS